MTYLRYVVIAAVCVAALTASGAAEAATCYACGLFQTLQSSGEDFTTKVYTKLAPLCVPTARLLGAISIFIFLAQLFLSPSKGPELVKEFLKQFAWLIVVAALLTPTGSTWLFSTIRDPLQGAGIGVAQVIMTTVGESPDAASFSGFAIGTTSGAGASGTVSEGSYAWLWSAVEQSIYPVIGIVLRSPDVMTIACPGSTQTADGSFWGTIKDAAASVANTFGAMVAFIYSFLLAAPFVLVGIVFATFIIQVLFGFLAISAVSPILVLFLAAPFTRGMVGAAIKILLTQALTLVFAGVALGFTRLLMANAMTDIKLSLCATSDISFTSSYLTLAMLGVISVILHLQAPKFASNIGGAAESAATAGMAMAGASMAGGKLMSMAGTASNPVMKGAAALDQATGGTVSKIVTAFSGRGGNPFDKSGAAGFGGGPPIPPHLDPPSGGGGN